MTACVKIRRIPLFIILTLHKVHSNLNLEETLHYKNHVIKESEANYCEFLQRVRLVVYANTNMYHSRHPTAYGSRCTNIW